MNAAAVPPRAENGIDLDGIRRNVRRLRELTALDLPDGHEPPQVMVVVKGDAYGHGMAPVARAAREAGADWLGVATPEEALSLRAAGDHGRLMCWLSVLGDDLGPVVAEDVDVAAYTVGQLREIAGSARALGTVARVHLQIDTGLSRGGASAAHWAELLAEAVLAERAGDVRIVGVWSHLACADQPAHPANDEQEQAFRAAVAAAEEVGLRPEVRHLANSAGALLRPSVRFDLVRLGIAVYGLTPAPDVVSSRELGLVPAMTLRGRIVLGKQLQAGDGVSYGHTFVADRPMTAALVPLGYADGIPRHASSRAQVQLNGRRAPVLGRICMDQFVVGGAAEEGDEVVLFGSGAGGEPTAQDWAEWCDTISYEIVTRMRGREARRWVNA
jgi:alanine racemase